MKLALGTAQFGMNYGISNSSGKTSSEEVARILDYAYQEGISLFDTAAAYGGSEVLLGDFFCKNNSSNVVTKVPRLNKNLTLNAKIDGLTAAVEQSLRNLRVSSLYGLLLHSADDLLDTDGERIYEKLKKFQASGVVKKIGVSVYSKEQIDSIVERYQLDIIQMPINIFDQRLLREGYLKSVKARDVDIHIRSIFLQGLLLMDHKQIPEYFKQIITHFIDYQAYIKTLGLTPLQAALGFANSIPEVDAIIFGVNDLSQLKEVCQYKNTKIDLQEFKKFALNDPNFVNPALWPQ